MKVLVLGSGVIGVTSAYYLARAGHEVTVIDVSEQLVITDAFVIASADNERQVQAIVDAVEEAVDFPSLAGGSDTWAAS